MVWHNLPFGSSPTEGAQLLKSRGELRFDGLAQPIQVGFGVRGTFAISHQVFLVLKKYNNDRIFIV